MTRRKQLLVEAAELFAAKGFHGVSMADVGAACGISGPALYRHFTSKTAMLSEMLVSASEELLRQGQIRTAATDPVVVLRALVRWHIDFALRNKALIVLQDREWEHLPGAARDKVRRLQRAYVDLWVETLRAVHPSLELDRARTMAQAVFGLLNSTPRSSHLPPEEMAPLLEEMAAAAMRLESQPAASASQGRHPAGLDHRG